MARFNLYQRGKVWYCRFKNETTGKWTAGKSTGETDKAAATAWAYHAQKYGIPGSDDRTAADIIHIDTILTQIRTADRLDEDDADRIIKELERRGLVVSGNVTGSPGLEDTVDYLTRFWTWNDSPYIKEKLSRGHSMTRQHATNRLRHIVNYWKPVFQGIPLAQLSRHALRAFADSLADSKIAPATRNHVILAGTVALRWAFHNEIIRTDVTAGLKGYSAAPRKRGTLTLGEVEKLFSMPWPDERAKLANMTAALTGLRQGEIAALRLQDVADDRLLVRHSWSRSGELKGTKTGETREVPILPALRDELRRLGANTPHAPAGPGSFVFWTPHSADRPLTPRMYAIALDRALLRLDGITDKVLEAAEGGDPDAKKRVADSQSKWKARNVVFHSWRHFYAATLSGQLDARTIMSATGHRSESVFAEYADHINAERFERVAAAGAETFGQIVQFPGKEVAQ